MIGGKFCKKEIGPSLLNAAGQTLTQTEIDKLWKLFQAIGIFWKDLHPKKTDSSNLKSSWFDFLNAKTGSDPSYVAEYSNAVLCVDELIEVYGEAQAYELLFVDHGIPDGPPQSRLAHAKKYVVDEFIRVNVVASGFKSFGGPDYHGINYKGYLGGSRYNLRARVKFYEPEAGEK